jgi:hypothetical protein
MDQPNEEKQRAQGGKPTAPNGEQPQHGEPKKDDVAKEPEAVTTEAKPIEEEPDQEEPQERYVRIGLREIVAAVAGGVILIVIGIVVFHNRGDGVVEPEPPPLPRIPPAQVAKDRAVPNAKSPVKERVWAPEATTFAEPFKLDGAGQPIPHN